MSPTGPVFAVAFALAAMLAGIAFSFGGSGTVAQAGDDSDTKVDDGFETVKVEDGFEDFGGSRCHQRTLASSCAQSPLKTLQECGVSACEAAPRFALDLGIAMGSLDWGMITKADAELQLYLRRERPEKCRVDDPVSNEPCRLAYWDRVEPRLRSAHAERPQSAFVANQLARSLLARVEVDEARRLMAKMPRAPLVGWFGAQVLADAGLLREATAAYAHLFAQARVAGAPLGRGAWSDQFGEEAAVGAEARLAPHIGVLAGAKLVRALYLTRELLPAEDACSVLLGGPDDWRGGAAAVGGAARGRTGGAAGLPVGPLELPTVRDCFAVHHALGATREIAGDVRAAAAHFAAAAVLFAHVRRYQAGRGGFPLAWPAMTSRWARAFEAAGEPPGGLAAATAVAAAEQAGATEGADDGADGGWAGADSEVEAELLLGHRGCDLPRVEVASASEAELEGLFSSGTPFLLRGALEGWPAWRTWRREALERRGWSVRPRRSHDVHRANQGHVGEGGAVSFAEYLELSRAEASAPQATAPTAADAPNASAAAAGGAHYLFDRRPYRGLVNDYRHPAAFERRQFSRGRAARDANALFYHGGAGTGTFCHQHTSAWNGLLWGRKRWFVFAPLAHVGAAEPPFVQRAPTDMRTWLNVTLPLLATRPAECVQEAGELLWLPDGYPHCVLNLRESVGVAVEIGPEDRPMKYERV